MPLFDCTKEKDQLTASLLLTTKRWRCSHGRSPPTFPHSSELSFIFSCFFFECSEQRPKQSGPMWKSLCKAASTGEHLGWTLHSIFEDKGRRQRRESHSPGDTIEAWVAVWVPGRLIEAAQVQVHGRQVIYFTSGLVSHGWERRSSPRNTDTASWEE